MWQEHYLEYSHVKEGLQQEMTVLGNNLSLHHIQSKPTKLKEQFIIIFLTLCLLGNFSYFLSSADFF